MSIENHIGKKFNSLLVVSVSDRKDSNGKRYLNCKCDCGKECCVRANNVTSGETKCCGCVRGPRMDMRKDETGKQYGKLTVISISDKRDKKKNIWFNCKCDCGKDCVIRGASLRGGTKSCGCLAALVNIKGYDVYSSEYNIFSHIKGRCYNTKNHSYPDYGGRGIRVCDRWLEGFQYFLEDMGPRPSKLHSVERIDNGGNYEPTNCKWATQAEQMMNRRVTVRLEINGQKYVLKEAANILGITYEDVRNLYYKRKLTGQQIYDKIQNEKQSLVSCE